MTDPLYSLTLALPNLLLDLNLNMNLNPETTMHGDMYTAKYRQPDAFYEPVLFQTYKKIKASHAMFKVTGFVDFGPYLK